MGGGQSAPKVKLIDWSGMSFVCVQNMCVHVIGINDRQSKHDLQLIEHLHSDTGCI